MIQCRRNFETLIENPLLPLDAYIFRPFHKPVKVFLGGQSSSNAKLLRPLLKERVHNLLLHLKRCLRFRVRVRDREGDKERNNNRKTSDFTSSVVYVEYIYIYIRGRKRIAFPYKPRLI